MTDVRFESERVGSAMVVRFSHLPTRNALDRLTRERLVERLTEWDADVAITTVILTGADPAFTSGVDAKQLLADDYVPLPVNPADTLRAMTTPTIAAVNGACVSGGLEIALGCSFILASDHATFADTHARVGLVPGWGLSAELPRAVGVARARQLTFTAEPIDATTALAWGLANEVIAHDRLMPRALALATAISRVDQGALSESARLYREGQAASLRAARQAEAAAHGDWRVDRPASRAGFLTR